ncbi:MAG: hypothetical protein OEV42_13295 [Deltaproteobacteria bacterium]|nr:hypothetical protein [Deltaproteobacteria bacterium]
MLPTNPKFISALEDKFQIALSQEEVAEHSSPDMLAELIRSKLNNWTDEMSHPDHGFYTVRKSLMKNFGLSRDQIRFDTRFESIFGRKNRKKNWAILFSSISSRKKVYKPIDRPTWLKVAIYLAMPFVVFPAVYLGTDKHFELAAFYSVFLFFFLLLLTVPFKKEFPKQFQTVGDLVKIAGPFEVREWTREEVEEIVKKLITDHIPSP